MADAPYVYAPSALRPVAPGGTRLRVPRRRNPKEQPPGDEGEAGSEAEWGELLEASVDELNRAFEGAGAPFRCHLEVDEGGLSLVVRRTDGDPGEGEVEEALSPADFPQWLGRLRSRLGLLVDQRA